MCTGQRRNSQLSQKISTNLLIINHCSLANCLWDWIARYNNFTFTCVDDLWHIDACIPYKDNNICEMGNNGMII
jgi:hypothetical protein